MPHLFEPYSVRSLTLRNRIGVSPMCQYSSVDGMATDWHFVHIGSRAVGGAGLVVAEATAVTPQGRISPQDAGIWTDTHVEPLERITRFVKEQGAIAGIQLAHAGRKGSAARPWEGGGSLSDQAGGWDTLGPSAVAFGDTLTRVPREMTLADIQALYADFRASAGRALAAGYEWLELHAAHGYLLHNFYSPLSNRRTDAYGGSFENRVRIVMETVQSLRQVWPEHLPLAVRLSCSDWVEGGWTIEESIDLARRLKQEGVDVIDCSSGFNTPDHRRYPFGPGWQAAFADRIRREAGIATAAVGDIRSPAQADGILRSGQADLVLLAREELRDPYWPMRAARELDQRVDIVPPQYQRAH